MLCNKLPPCNPKIRGVAKKSGDRGEPQEYRLQLLLDVRWIIEPTRIEGRRDHGHQELDGAQGVGGCGHGVGLEGGAGDLDHAYIVLHDPIADLVPDLKATPFHTLSLLVEIFSTGDPFSRRRCDAPIPGLTALPRAKGKHLASMAIGLYCLSTCASAASVWGSQNVMSMARYSTMAAHSSVRACSRRAAISPN